MIIWVKTQSCYLNSEIKDKNHHLQVRYFIVSCHHIFNICEKWPLKLKTNFQKEHIYNHVVFEYPLDMFVEVSDSEICLSWKLIYDLICTQFQVNYLDLYLQKPRK